MGTGEHTRPLAELGQLVREARGKTGLSQRALADAAGHDFGYSWLQEVEAGGRPGKPFTPRSGTLSLLVKHLNARLADDDKLDEARILALAGYGPGTVQDNLTGRPAGQPPVKTRALAEKLSMTTPELQRAVETIVDDHLRLRGLLPSPTPMRVPATAARGSGGLPTSLGEHTIADPPHETAPESVGDAGAVRQGD